MGPPDLRGRSALRLRCNDTLTAIVTRPLGSAVGHRQLSVGTSYAVTRDSFRLTRALAQAVFPVTIRCFQRPGPKEGRSLSKPNSSAGGGNQKSSARSALPIASLARRRNRHLTSNDWKPRTVPITLVRKEVIQPQVPLRLPCYDFAPVTGHTMGGYLPCGLVCRLPVQQTSMA
jgi:hypothetical protein